MQSFNLYVQVFTQKRIVWKKDAQLLRNTVLLVHAPFKTQWPVQLNHSAATSPT